MTIQTITPKPPQVRKVTRPDGKTVIQFTYTKGTYPVELDIQAPMEVTADAKISKWTLSGKQVDAVEFWEAIGLKPDETLTIAVPAIVTYHL